MTNEELVAEIQAGINVQENMAELYQQNRGRMCEIAVPFAGFGELDDLLQEAYFGLEKAVHNYDPSKGFKFMTYAENWIRQAIQRYCQNNGRLKRLPVHVLERISKYQRFRSTVRAATGEEPSDIEYMNHLGISNKVLMELRKYVEADVSISLDSPLPGTEDFSLGDTIPDAFDLEGTVVDAVARQQAKTTIWDAVADLPGQCPTIIEGRFKCLEPYQETADRLEISVERVRFLLHKALGIMQRSKKIQEVAQTYDYGTDSLYHWGIGRFERTNTSSVEFIALKHLDLEESRKQVLEPIRDIQTTVPVISEKIQRQAGFVPAGVRRLEQLNAQFEELFRENLEKSKRKNDGNHRKTQG